jgi:mannose-6-phosphate isomerase-like protein (cupin superfamily)
MREEDVKMVKKPWGREIWLELNDGYCYKRIYISKGHQTSLQYHERKKETNYIIDGDAEVWIQDPNGETRLVLNGVEYRFSLTNMGKGNFFTIVPLTIHRIKALTDLVLQEVSTPEVDDIIRLQDDTGRTHGKINSEHEIPHRK